MTMAMAMEMAMTNEKAVGGWVNGREGGGRNLCTAGMTTTKQAFCEVQEPKPAQTESKAKQI